ncbi:MAG: hypothetical protein ACR2F1_11730 [Nitrososphaeraceae archaeon]
MSIDNEGGERKPPQFDHGHTNPPKTSTPNSEDSRAESMTTTDDSSNNNNDYSNESHTTQYTSMEGIRTKSGINNDRLFGTFIVKELVDNALDYIGTNAKEFVNGQNPYVSVFVTEEESGKLVKIRVRNSSTPGINNSLTKERVEKIFNLDKNNSSKRHRHVIKRGALGDGLKSIFGLPYAFASENNSNDNSNYPLKINISNEKVFEVRINDFSEVKRNIKTPKVNVNEIVLPKTEEQEVNDIQKGQFTEITTYIPRKLTDYNNIRSLFYEYVVLNTHIEFNIKSLPYVDNLVKVPVKKDEYRIQNWSNLSSIYYYDLYEFQELIYSLEDQNNHYISGYLQRNFREGASIKKEELVSILSSTTVISTNNTHKNIEGIYQRLKKIEPIRNQSDNKPQLQFPFDRKFREKALKERFTRVFKIGEDDVDNSIKYKLIRGYYHPAELSSIDDKDNNNNDNKIEYPFMLEIIVANIPGYEKPLHFFQFINFSPSLQDNPFHNQQSLDNIFTWKNKQGQKKSEPSVKDILEDCKYSSDPKKHKKTSNFVFMNLISPRVDYRNLSKSRINLIPVATVAQEIYNFLNSVSNTNTIKNKDNSQRQIVKTLLERRLNSVLENPNLKKTDRWTQSTVFYRVRPILINKGYNDIKRSYITKIIKDLCEEIGKEYRGKGYKRHELGIIAAERAQLYFNGKALGISFDKLEEHMKKGTDLLVIEKEGIADVLTDFADKRGIAILNSRGFLTEYAEELSELAKQNGCNIAILTDLDSSGLLISSNLPNAHRIGIDFKTLDYFHLDEGDVQEEVVHKVRNDKSESDNHLTSLNKFDCKIPLPYNKIEWLDLIEFLDGSNRTDEKKMRIEIDSVIAQPTVGNEKFWNYILEELDKVFKTRNYNRAIDVPTHVKPKKFEAFIEDMTNKFSEIQAPEQQNIIKELESVEGFFDDVQDKKAEIEERLRSKVETNPEVTKIISEAFNKKFSVAEE